MRNGTVTYPLAGIAIIYDDFYLLQALMKWDKVGAGVRTEAARRGRELLRAAAVSAAVRR